MKASFKLSLSLFFLLLFFATSSVDAQIAWVPYEGKIPDEAISGGNEPGRRLPVCRCLYNGSWHPGKVVADNCNIGWGGEEIVISSGYEIMVKPARNMEMRWVEVKDNHIPKNAVVAGTENGQNLYVGRAKHTDGYKHPGKIFKVEGNYICNFGYGGKEITSKSGFEVLVAKDAANGRN